jgi:predicted amidohydrolase
VERAPGPECHVEVHHLWHAAQPDHRLCDRQRGARVPSFDDRGTLNVGAPADVAILELREKRLDDVKTGGLTFPGSARRMPDEQVLACAALWKTP